MQRSRTLPENYVLDLDTLIEPNNQLVEQLNYNNIITNYPQMFKSMVNSYRDVIMNPSQTYDELGIKGRSVYTDNPLTKDNIQDLEINRLQSGFTTLSKKPKAYAYENNQVDLVREANASYQQEANLLNSVYPGTQPDSSLPSYY